MYFGENVLQSGSPDSGYILFIREEESGSRSIGAERCVDDLLRCANKLYPKKKLGTVRRYLEI